MAYLGDARYDLSVSYTDSEQAKRTKTINYLNYNGTGSGGGSSALGVDDETLYNLATLINESIIGGVVTGYALSERRDILNG